MQRFEPTRSLLEPEEEAELAELAEADALLAEAEDKLASLDPVCYYPSSVWAFGL